jgi:hypothetical protein
MLVVHEGRTWWVCDGWCDRYETRPAWESSLDWLQVIYTRYKPAHVEHFCPECQPRMAAECESRSDREMHRRLKDGL